MNRLSAADALFLYLETPETPMHVGSLTIFAPPVPDDLFRRFRDHTVARFDLLPSYRRRVQTMPLGIDHPVWVDAGEIDLDYHIRHIILPKPGSMDELRSVVARRHMIPLDRARPLWQYYLIEGLEDGGFAIYVKVHHSDMDGVVGVATLPFIFDFAADAPPFVAPPTRITPAGETDFSELVGTALGNFLRQGVRAITSVPSLARTLVKIGRHPLRDVRYLVDTIGGVPRTIFNTAISRLRGFGTASLPLADVKAVAKARHATINDVVLAVSAGALRRYLAERDALPEKPLMAAVPASMRAADDTRLNNQVVFTFCKLATDIADPLQRLTAIMAAAQDSKAVFSDVKESVTTEISVPGAPLMLSGLAWLWRQTGAADFLPAAANVVISNVPGPRIPMYCAGAPATHYFPLSIPYHGNALNITVESYLDTLDFGIVTCQSTVPRVQTIADYLVEEFALLRQATEALAQPEAIETIEIARDREPEQRAARPRAVRRRETSPPDPAPPRRPASRRSSRAVRH